MQVTNHSKTRYVGALLVAIAALSWSTAGLFTRVVASDLPTTLFGRSLAGGLCVMAIYVALKKQKISLDLLRFSGGEIQIAVLSALGMICFVSAFFYTSIANVTFIYGTMPLVTLVMSVVVLRTRATMLGIACCTLSALGVMTIMWGQENLSDWAGCLLAFGMTFFMAALTIAAKFHPKADSVKATYLAAFIGAALMLPFSDFNGMDTAEVGILLAYGLVNVGLGFGIYLLGVARVSALTAALIGLIELPLAPLWGWYLFGEALTPQAVIGGAVVIGSTVLYLVVSEMRQHRVLDESA